jgi:PAS domain S-box-containing protein
LNSHASFLEIFDGSPMASRIDSVDWDSSAVGGMPGWGPTLAAMVRLVLASRQPMLLLWGRQLVQIYNDGCAEVLGTGQMGNPASEQVGPLWQAVLPEARALLDGVRTGTVADRPVAVVRGKERAWWKTACTPVHDGAAIVGVLATFTDCTDEFQLCQAMSTELAYTREQAKSAETASNSLRQLYEAILSSTPDLVYVFDLDYRFIYANDVLLTMWGRTAEEALGKTCLELGYEPWHAEMHAREIDQVRDTKQPIRGEVPFEGAFGRRMYEYIFVPVIGSDGRVQAVAGTTRDVTERKEAEVALRDENIRKDEFLAMLAHELRNPLAPIAAASTLLRVRPLDDQRLMHISDVVGRQVRHMTGLVDDLLDVSRVTRGHIALTLEPVDLRTVVAEAAEQVGPLMTARHHLLTINGTQMPMMVNGDHKRLVQVISNLLNNAAKYTPDGGTVAVELLHGASAHVLSVRDSGIGMTQELVAHAFDLFVQGQRTADRSQGGLGIGLALVRKLVELHSGHITARSDGTGHGSTFTVALPAA